MKRILFFFLDKKNFLYFNVLFLIILCFNINNKTLTVFSLTYLFINSFIQHSFSKGLIFSYFLFSLFWVGKTYTFLLIPASNLIFGNNKIGYPGYQGYIIIDPGFIIGTILTAYLVYLIKNKKVEIEKLDFLLIIFLVLALFSTFLSLNYNISLYIWFNFLFIFCFYILLKNTLLQDKYMINQLLSFFCLIVIYENIWAILQFIKGGELFSSLESGSSVFWSEDAEISSFTLRTYGSFPHVNVYANFIAPFAVIFYLTGYIKKFSKKIQNFICLIIALFGIIISISRSSWISFFIPSLIFTYIFEKKIRLSYNPIYKKGLIYITLIFLPLLFIFIKPRLEGTLSTFNIEGSGLTRIELIKESINFISKHPLFGSGPGMSVLGMYMENPNGEMFYFPFPVHNLYLHLISEFGIPASTVFFIFIIFLIRSKTKYTKISNLDNVMLKKIYLAAAIAILISGLFELYFVKTNMLYLITFLTLYKYG